MGYHIPMTILIVEDDVPFLLGMETIRTLTNGIKWESTPTRRQWLELQDGQQLDLVEVTDGGHIGIPWSGATRAPPPTMDNNKGKHKATSTTQGIYLTPSPDHQQGRPFQFTNILSALIKVVCLTILWNPVLKNIFETLKKYFDPEDLDLIDLKIEKIKYIIKLRQTDPILGVSDTVYEQNRYKKVYTSYEFLRDLSTFGVISNFDRATYYIKLETELEYFLHKKKILFGNKTPNKIYIERGKRITKNPKKNKNT